MRLYVRVGPSMELRQPAWTGLSKSGQCVAMEGLIHPARIGT
jgi:hypothetical protein